MLTPLLMAALLVLPFVFRNVAPVAAWRAEPRAAAAAGVALVLLVTASGHFVQTDAMSLMLPPWVPLRRLLVYATGVLEFAIALALMSHRFRTLGAGSAVAVLVLFFPANVYAAMEQVPIGGHAWGPSYLLVRAPLQALLVWWTWAMVLRPPRTPATAA